ncbi:MAG: hypothetical protein J6Y92_09755 [Lentisphaeria bacterium]|nr:hypothetical protein [Lentisphaeria bacterium]
MSFFYLPYLYLPALLIFTWLFRREPCDYPWSRIRKVLFACLLILTQVSLVAGFMGWAAFGVNMKARGAAQGYVRDVQTALGEANLPEKDIWTGTVEKYFPASAQAELSALKKTLVVRFVLVLIGWFLMLGVLSADVRFKLKTLPFLLLFYGCAAGNCVADFYLGESDSDLGWWQFKYGTFWEFHQAVYQRIISSKDRLALRLAFEDVYDAHVWRGMETDDPDACDRMCEKLLSVLDESLRKHGSNGAAKPAAPKD